MHKLTRPQFLSLVFLLFLILLLPIVLIQNQKQKQLLSKAEEKLIALNATPSATMSPTIPAPSSIPTATRIPTPLPTVTPTPIQPTPTKIPTPIQPTIPHTPTPTSTPTLTPTPLPTPTKTPTPTSLPTLSRAPTQIPPTPFPILPTLFTSLPTSLPTLPLTITSTPVLPTIKPSPTVMPFTSPPTPTVTNNPTSSPKKTSLDTVVDFFANIFTEEKKEPPSIISTPSPISPSEVLRPSISPSSSSLQLPEEKTIIDTVLDVITAPFRWLFGERKEETQSDIVFPQSPEILKDKEAVKLYFEIKRETNILLSILEKYEKAKKQGAVPNTLINQMNQQLTHRKNLMLKVAQKYPYVFLENTLPYDVLSRFDQSFTSSLESSPTTEQGELQVLHIDDFENHTNSIFEYYLQTSLNPLVRYRLYPAGDFPNLLSGSIIKVRGYILGDAIIFKVPPHQPNISSPQLLPTPSPTPSYSSMNNHHHNRNNNSLLRIKPVHAQEPPNQEIGMEVIKEAQPETLGGQRVAVILVKEKGATFTPYYSKEQIEEMIFRGEIQQFFKEASYGKMWLDEEKSKVYGWYEVEGLNVNRRDDIKDTTSRKIINITDADIDFSQFDRIMIGASNSVDTYGGWGDIGKRTYATADGDVYLSSSFFGIGHSSVNIFAHEFGHNLGVWHANSWNCDQGGVQGNCHHKEYGNRFDVMGVGNIYNHHFNGYFKEVFQWLNQPVVNITQSGRYTLQPIEQPEAVVARVRNTGANNLPMYYLETRAPLGFDNNKNTRDTIQGIHINWQNDSLETRLITLDYNNKTAFRPGETFQDAQSAVTITNIDDATVNVELAELPACKYTDDFNMKINDIYPWDDNNSEITCSDARCVLKRKTPDRVLLSFVLDIKNNREYLCPDGRLRVLLKSPWKVDHEPTQGETVDIPGQHSGEVILVASIPPETPKGTFRISFFLENLDTGSRISLIEKEIEIQDEFPMFEGDLNNDGKVDLFDLVRVSQSFGKAGAGLPEDINHDGKVDLFDLQLVASFFGKEVPITTLWSTQFTTESSKFDRLLEFSPIADGESGYTLTLSAPRQISVTQGYTQRYFVQWDKNKQFTKLVVFDIGSKTYKDVPDKQIQKSVIEGVVKPSVNNIFDSDDFSGNIRDNTTGALVNLKEPQKTQIFTQLDQALSTLLVN